MGILSDMRRRGRGPRPRSNGAKTGPLRRVVDSWYVDNRLFERYECGHEAEAKRDLMGYTNAARRRCRTCLAGQQRRDRHPFFDLAYMIEKNQRASLPWAVQYAPDGTVGQMWRRCEDGTAMIYLLVVSGLARRLAPLCLRIVGEFADSGCDSDAHKRLLSLLSLWGDGDDMPKQAASLLVEEMCKGGLAEALNAAAPMLYGRVQGVPAVAVGVWICSAIEKMYPSAVVADLIREYVAEPQLSELFGSKRST